MMEGQTDGRTDRQTDCRRERMAAQPPGGWRVQGGGDEGASQEGGRQSAPGGAV